MKTILIGNGLDIQYGGSDYYCTSIVKRALNNVTTGNYRETDYPALIVDHLWILLDLAREILNNRAFIDGKVWADDERVALNSFCLRYGTVSLKDVSEIGFEDYFLLQRLHFNLTYNPQIGNSQERMDYFEFLRRFFLDAIFNEGKICNIEYPQKLGIFLDQFDNIFSLNYDRNIEKMTNTAIHYLHGAFHVISEKYNNDSPMNKVMGIKAEVAGKEHLYSTALTTYCGKEKADLLTQADKVNSFLSLAHKFKEECERTGTEIYPQLKAIVLAKELCPEYVYPQNYCYHLFEKITDEIVILGLSPANDDHLIDVINKNICKITYYFYPHDNIESEKEVVKTIFKGREITFLPVTDLWNSIK